MSNAVEHCTARDLATYNFLQVTRKVAVCDRRTFERLREYSTSLPTGVCDGKVWKAKKYRLDENNRVQWLDGWLLGEYVEVGDYNHANAMVDIWWRELKVVEE